MFSPICILCFSSIYSIMVSILANWLLTTLAILIIFWNWDWISTIVSSSHMILYFFVQLFFLLWQSLTKTVNSILGSLMSYKESHENYKRTQQGVPVFLYYIYYYYKSYSKHMLFMSPPYYYYKVNMLQPYS